MEFLVIFIVTAGVLIFAALMMIIGRPPVYHVTREEAQEILQRQIKGELEEMKWLVFIGHSIPMDPELNELRLICAQIELDAEHGVLKYAASTKRYDSEGIAKVEQVYQQLQQLIANTPITKEF